MFNMCIFITYNNSYIIPFPSMEVSILIGKIVLSKLYECIGVLVLCVIHE